MTVAGGNGNGFAPDLAVRLMCRDCKNPNPEIREEYSTGDLVCGDCGLVLGDRIVDTRSEWRTFADSDGPDPSRVGEAEDPLLGVSTLETHISSKDGRSGVAKELHRINGRTQGSSITTLSDAFHMIGAMCDAISLPRNITDAARLLFKRVHDEKLLRGKSKEGICATCIFIAARQGRVPRTFKEVHAQTLVPKKVLWTCFKALELAFNLSSTGTGAVNGVAVASAVDRENAMVTTDASDILSRFCSHLDISRPITNSTIQLAHAVRESGLLAGRQPNTIAGACIVMATVSWGQPKLARELAPVACVSESTIQQAYRLLLPWKEALLKDVTAVKDGRMKIDLLPNVSS